MAQTFPQTWSLLSSSKIKPQGRVRQVRVIILRSRSHQQALAVVVVRITEIPVQVPVELHRDPGPRRLVLSGTVTRFAAGRSSFPTVQALNEAGETIEDLEAQGDQAKLEATLKLWMKARIKQIEEQRAASAAKQQSAA